MKRIRKRLTEAERQRLSDWENAAGYVPIDSQDIGMDNHNCNVVLMVVRRENDNTAPVLGFTYRQSSEEAFFEDDSSQLIPLTTRRETVVRYDRADGDDWGDVV